MEQLKIFEHIEHLLASGNEMTGFLYDREPVTDIIREKKEKGLISLETGLNAMNFIGLVPDSNWLKCLKIFVISHDIIILKWLIGEHIVQIEVNKDKFQCYAYMDTDDADEQQIELQENLKYISVVLHVTRNHAVTAEEGDSVYRIIKDALDNGYKVVLDFDMIEIATMCFFNDAIGKLYKFYSSDELKERLILKNLNQSDAKRLKYVTDNAKEFYKEKKEVMEDLYNEKKVIYLSGKIAGMDPYECESYFDKAEQTVLEMYSKYDKVEIVNPYKLPRIQDSWADYIIRDLIILKSCDVIAMLPNWENSPGAKVERVFAEGCGIEVIELYI